ncbi:MAG: hypothetical protein JXR25_04670 [Pontiellaceae bacterium]|nr:hypothetical protein [Pontiellaceae bacterium]MBN2784099.1 hypothetical protein [Pontiellaceae bacterium]
MNMLVISSAAMRRSVNDDCIALKGSKGPFAMEDKSSPPVECVHVEDCMFHRGHGVVTCGSEATIVRDLLVENCTVEGNAETQFGPIWLEDVEVQAESSDFKVCDAVRELYLDRVFVNRGQYELKR